MQLLYSIPQIRDLKEEDKILQLNFIENRDILCNAFNANQFNIINMLVDVMVQMKTSNPDVTDSYTNFISLIFEAGTKKQQDVQELFNGIFKDMKCINTSPFKTITSALLTSEIKYKYEYAANKDLQGISAIGLPDFNYVISLPLNGSTMQDCIIKYYEKETTENIFYRLNCKFTGDIPPEFLILLLKRHHYEISSGASKLQTPIEPNTHINIVSMDRTSGGGIENIDKITFASYIIHGVILHHGTDFNVGHYTFLKYDDAGNPQLLIDDNTTNKALPNSQTIKTDGYMFLYKKRELSGIAVHCSKNVDHAFTLTDTYNGYYVKQFSNKVLSFVNLNTGARLIYNAIMSQWQFYTLTTMIRKSDSSISATSLSLDNKHSYKDYYTVNDRIKLETDVSNLNIVKTVDDVNIIIKPIYDDVKTDNKYMYSDLFNTYHRFMQQNSPKDDSAVTGEDLVKAYTLMFTDKGEESRNKIIQPFIDDIVRIHKQYFPDKTLKINKYGDSSSTPTVKPTTTPPVKPTSTPSVKPTTTTPPPIPPVKPTTTTPVKPASTPPVKPTTTPPTTTKPFVINEFSEEYPSITIPDGIAKGTYHLNERLTRDLKTTSYFCSENKFILMYDDKKRGGNRKTLKKNMKGGDWKIIDSSNNSRTIARTTTNDLKKKDAPWVFMNKGIFRDYEENKIMTLVPRAKTTKVKIKETIVEGKTNPSILTKQKPSLKPPTSSKPDAAAIASYNKAAAEALAKAKADAKANAKAKADAKSIADAKSKADAKASAKAKADSKAIANPATVNPVTVNPVTVANPATVNPVTVNPVTVVNPVTANPVTVNPVTVNPVTVNPVTVKPVTSPIIAPTLLPKSDKARGPKTDNTRKKVTIKPVETKTSTETIEQPLASTPIQDPTNTNTSITSSTLLTLGAVAAGIVAASLLGGKTRKNKKSLRKV